MTFQRQFVRTLFVLASIVMFTGSACDDGPSVLGDSGNGPGESAAFEYDGNNPYYAGDDATNVSQNGSGKTGETGNGAAEGAPCAATSECGSGLSCNAAGTCESAAALEITLVWETDVDLDLHVITPLSEELYYRNREGSGGGEFLKDSCIVSECEEGVERTERAIWRDTSPEGTYQMWVVNYGGDSGASFRLEIRENGSLTRTIDGSIGGGAGEESARQSLEIGGASDGPGDLEITSPEHEMWVRGPRVDFSSETTEDEVTRVTYKAGNTEIGSVEGSNTFDLNYQFNNLGEHKIRASGYDDNDFERDFAEITIVVMDQNDGLPSPANGAVVSSKMSAKRLLYHSGSIGFANSHPSGVSDNAYPITNITDVSEGRTAANSCYGTAPCGRAALDDRMLQAMVMLKQVYGYNYQVSSIAGASHSSGSRHYSGRAVDVTSINGVGVSASNPHVNGFKAACREMGATEVLGPGNAGHSTHVHCAW